MCVWNFEDKGENSSEEYYNNNTSADENHLCGASLRKSQDLFEGIKAWSWYGIMVSQLHK